MIADNSIEAYHKEKESGRLTQSRQLVLNGLYTMVLANNRMLSEFLGIPINQVTGRITELRDKFGYIKKEKDGICPYSKTEKITSFWIVTEDGKEYAEKISQANMTGLRYRQYVVENHLDFNKFSANSKGKTSDKWHHVEVLVYPSGNIRSVCDCEDFNIRRKSLSDCKHIRDLKYKLKRDGEIDGDNTAN